MLDMLPHCKLPRSTWCMMYLDILTVQYSVQLICRYVNCRVYNPSDCRCIDWSIIQLIAHVTINICSVVLLLCITAFVSHLQAGHVQRNRFVINVSKLCTNEFIMQYYNLKCCWNVWNVDWSQVYYVTK